MTHLLIDGLMQELPEPGSDWPLFERETWIAAARAIFDLIYIDPPDEEVIEQPVPLQPAGAGANGAAEDQGPVAAAPSAPSRPAASYPPAVRIGDRIKCPVSGCGQTFRDNRGYPAHAKRHLNGNAPVDEALLERVRAVSTVDQLAPPPPAGVPDPRVIEDTCRKCGQRFTWRPALVSHERVCRGEAVA